jgi:hypothetical protein
MGSDVTVAGNGDEWLPPHDGPDVDGRPVLPGDDPFYQPPAGFERRAPGTVLRSRDVRLAFLGLIPQRFTATQLLYRTTDLDGRASTTVTTVRGVERRPLSETDR